jgi:hypothetical protein
MPGTSINVTTRSGPPSAGVAPEAVLYLAALAERGPTLTSPDASGKQYSELTSLADFRRANGDPQAYGWAYHAVRTHFEDGGLLVRLVRVVGAAATRGTLQRNDRAGVPVPTLRFDAVSEGAWSARVSVQIRDGLLANTFDVIVLYDGGLTDTEEFLGLASPAAAAAAITGKSAYVTATALVDASVAPANNPAVAAPVALSAGTDDRGTVVAADYVTALNDAFPIEVGTGVVAVPGFTSAQVGAGLVAHCQATERNFYTAGPEGETIDDAKAGARALLGVGGEFGRYLWPWVTYTDEAGVTYQVPPEGFAAAGRAKAIKSAGVWQADAGSGTRSKFLDGVVTSVGKAVADDADNAHVTVIRLISGRPEVYGMRSLSLDDAWALFKFRDLVNKVSHDLRAITEDLEFGTVDSRGRFLGLLSSKIRAYLQPIAAAGGLFARFDAVNPTQLIDPGYSVDVSAAVNPAALLAQRKVAANVTIRPSESANDIVINLVKAALTASV